ncbi:MAG: hypothetical protein A6F71_00400 [Cycloclasticus sp. symbiont of Poecilosclerida sp. M]|nr:MAG: hypothetical protein A6F71_00400 [Cycloclasticus sp. symbiont of Poecilosclerida sp. M]
MNTFKLLIVLILITSNTAAFAYGGSSSGQKACNKPTFSQFTPPHLSEVSPNSSFTFLASASTVPSSIKVVVKKIPVDVITKKDSNGYTVSGTLAPSLKDTYARINIQAIGANRCPGSDGWLLKVN